ncbi:hypothetical protein [Streptomyces sp. NPDC059224]|uniref:phage tail protein n=1 Tax=Streptomyces sp. NPDC059224 TaxID=3346775 RepID=UPI00369F8490
MPEDINLPDLVSHLNVDLGGLSGTIADAQRQGSSIGAALGAGVQRELRDLVSHLPEVQIDGNSTDLDRDLARVRREIEELSNQRIGIDIPIDQAIRRINELQPHIQRLSEQHPDINVQASTRQAAAQLDALLASARRVDGTNATVHVDVDEDRLSRLPGILGRITSGLGSIGGIGATIGKAAAGIGAIVPAAASVVTTLANVAPAGAIAVTGLAAVQLASGTVKLAAAGMGDALTAALDPSKADDYADALKKLSPEARQFAEAVHDAAPALHALQQEVQDKTFDGWSTQLQRTAKSVLPVLRQGVLSMATTLNQMGAGVLAAGKELADSGTLGRAIGSASKGLRNLAGVPGIVVRSLGQIGAAAGPSFEKLTGGAAGVVSTIGDKLSKAFASGGLQSAIEHAVDLIGQLLTVGVNVGKIIGNIFTAIPAGGGGLVGILGQVSAALADISSSPEVQSGLKAIFTTMSTLGATVAPLLAQALRAIAPVFTALGPPIQTLITALGGALSPIIDALGPVLVSAAGAVGALLTAVSPLLPVIGQLVAALLPALSPLLDGLTTIFTALAPVVQVVADVLGDTLTPILSQLPGLIGPLAAAFADIAVKEGPILADLLTQLAPSFVQLAKSLGDTLVQLGPLLPQFVLLGSQLFEKIAPYLPSLIQSIAQLAGILNTALVVTLQYLVIPALKALNILMSGDTPRATAAAGKAMSILNTIVHTAWNAITAYVRQKIDEAVKYIAGLPGRGAAALGGLAGSLSAKASQAGSSLLSALRSKLDAAVAEVRSIPGRARSALGSLGGVLVGAGASLISGFVAGIRSKIGAVQSTLQSLTGKLTDWKGPKAKDAKILTPAGKLLIEGFIKGITGTTAKLQSTLASITKALPANVRSGYGKVLAKATAELQKEVTKRDAVIKKLATAQKNLDSLISARSKAAGNITSGILQEANITTGHEDVNSVSSITVGLQQSLKAAQAFQANIAKLKKSGLRSDLLQQIADAGVEGGAATAAALAKATPAQLKQINDLQGKLSKAATATGNTVGDALYGAGIKAAQGLVAGLKSQEKAIEAMMRKIAENMLKTVKKTHKTHSPSRAFHDIGVMDGEGLRGGFQSMAAKIQAAYRSVAGGALDIAGGALAVPSGPQLAAVSAGAGRGGDVYHINLNGTRATPQDMIRELSWRGLVGGG